MGGRKFNSLVQLFYRGRLGIAYENQSQVTIVLLKVNLIHNSTEIASHQTLVYNIQVIIKASHQSGLVTAHWKKLRQIPAFQRRHKLEN